MKQVFPLKNHLVAYRVTKGKSEWIEWMPAFLVSELDVWDIYTLHESGEFMSATECSNFIGVYARDANGDVPTYRANRVMQEKFGKKGKR